MKILDWLFGVIANPGPTFREVSREKPMGWAFLLYLGLITLTSWRSGIDLQEFNISPGQLLVASLIIYIIMFFVGTGLVNLIAKGFRGTGNFQGLFSALAFANFPAIFLPVGQLLGQVAGPAGNVLSRIISFAVLVWVFVLDILALRESHELSSGKSFLVYFLVALILLAFLVITLVAGLLTMPEF